MRGRFISLEGPEGCGKSTQAGLLATHLRERGQTVVMTREPGGTPTGEMIRDILQHHASGEDISPEAEVLLFAASRAQHVARVIRPALERGDWVICDRFVDSSLAYQGVARGMGLETVLAANEVALGGLWPDVTLWFDLPVDVALSRVAARGADADRFESEARAFHQKVAEGYRELAKRFPERILRVEASGEIDAIAECVSAHLDCFSEVS
ncbi:MAG: dTMP kinase [Verrucomicrobia bacterium]|nr:dTMP kinase [Verrucomicrobiota bacterium]MCH8512094.1 dTMP kinase [Kiritimatiellia bacterium]